MKLQPDKSSAPLVRALGPGWVQIDAQRHEQSVLVSSIDGQDTLPWDVRTPQDIAPQNLDPLAQWPVELVILGTGQHQHRPPAACLAAFVQQRVGLEWMDTAAACRTYNILASEGRKVAAALLIEE